MDKNICLHICRTNINSFSFHEAVKVGTYTLKASFFDVIQLGEYTVMRKPRGKHLILIIQIFMFFAMHMMPCNNSAMLLETNNASQYRCSIIFYLHL